MPKSRRSRKSRRSTRRVRRGGAAPMPNMPKMPMLPMPMPPMPNIPAQKGGKTKRKASSWNKAVSRVYHEMKRKNSNATFGQAMKEASARKKKGTL